MVRYIHMAVSRSSVQRRRLGTHFELSVRAKHTGHVEIEEIRVEHRLHDTGNRGNRVEEAFGLISVEPVEDVEGPVDAQCEEIVSGDRLGVSGSGKHEELGHDGDGLEVD